MTDLRQKLLATFQVEHQEHLGQIRALLAGLEGAVGPGRQVEEVFRRAHSLKGAARAVDLRAIETLAHRLETLFSQVREGKLRLEPDVVSLILRTLDASEDVAAGRGESAPALAALNRLLGLEDAGPPPAAPQPPAPRLDTVRLRTETLDKLLRSTAEWVTESRQQSHLAAQLERLAGQAAAVEGDWERLRRPAGSALLLLAGQKGFAAFARRLDSAEHGLRALTGEARAASRQARRQAFSVAQRGRRLQEDILGARLTSAAAVCEGFGPMVRDLARDQGKQVDFEAAGLDTQADRVVLQALKDPIVQLLRNAVTHGLEPASARAARGKAPAGRLRLQMAVEGRRLAVLVEDDGAGIDVAAVAAQAVRQGLLSAEEAARRSAEELARLIFAPGFSTVRRVTELAGRGMGLSIVAEQLRRIQGEVELRSTGGAGAAFFLSAPLSVATHRLLLVACCSHTFALPLDAVRRVARVRLDQLETAGGRPVLRFQQQTVPLAALAPLLGWDDPGSADGWLRVVVVQWSGALVALAVDALLDQREAVLQDLGLSRSRTPLALGAILLEDGAAAVVLDPGALLAGLRRSPPAALLPAVPPQPHRLAPSILVVDDSLTTRTLEKSILEAHGYRVRTAVDGLEALSCLRRDRPALVIADIQMPGLDGFGLLERMKQDARLASLPVILLTSLESPQDQEKGLALGADAYILKRKFDQRDLLETIRQLVGQGSAFSSAEPRASASGGITAPDPAPLPWRLGAAGEGSNSTGKAPPCP